MGFFRRGSEDEPALRYRMREKLIAIGDDYWIEDSSGNKAYKVNGKAARIRDTWILEDPSGHEVAKIQERKFSIRDAVKIEVGGQEAVVKKALVGIRDRFHIELEHGDDLKAHGNFVGHEYKIEQDGHDVAEVSRKWFRIRDTYGVEIEGDVDPALILSITVAIDSFTHD